MKAQADQIRMQFNESGDPELVLTLKMQRRAAREATAELKEVVSRGKSLSVEVKQYRAKRSLDSNSYCWVLISKIADLIGASKEEVYIDMLTRYGQREPRLLSVVSEAVDMVFRATNNHCTVVGESELNGKLFKHLAILIGSSQYDTKQMSIFIDGIVSECKELGIETIPEAELKSLKETWRKEGVVSGQRVTGSS